MADKKPADDKPKDKPADAKAKPKPDDKPADKKPVDNKPADVKPVAATPATNNANDAKDAKDNDDDFEMEYRMLGGTGLKVSTLGFGLMTPDSKEQTMLLLSTVRKYGVTFFDNAEFYGDPCGKGEEYFGQALKELQKKDPNLWRRSDLVITTKIFFGPGDGNMTNISTRSYGPNDIGTNRKHLMEGIDASLKRLQLDYVDVVLAHRYDALTPMIETVRGFTDIINSGKALYWGTSMWTSQKITEAYWIAKINKLIAPVVEQPVYNMFRREIVEKEFKPLYMSPYKIGLTTWSPLDTGILTGKYIKDIPSGSRLGGHRLGKFWGNEKYITQEKNKRVAKLMEIAKELKVSMVSLALGWVIKNKNVSVCLLGGTKPHQLEQNVKAIGAAKKLTPAIIKRIEDILENKPKFTDRRTGLIRTIKNITNPL